MRQITVELHDIQIFLNGPVDHYTCDGQLHFQIWSVPAVFCFNSATHLVGTNCL